MIINFYYFVHYDHMSHILVPVTSIFWCENEILNLEESVNFNLIYLTGIAKIQSSASFLTKRKSLVYIGIALIFIVIRSIYEIEI